LIVYEGFLKGTSVEPGVIVTLAGLTPQVMAPFSTFAALGVTASSSWPAVALVTRWLAEKSRIQDRPNARTIDTVDATMEARGLRFKYETRPNHVFNNLNFVLKPGTITGLVARMGQGKTTFFRLALRLYEPEAGQILLGGTPHSEFTLKSLRRHIAMLAQFPAFSHDTVRENFLIAQPDATDEEIRKLSEKTGLWSILEQNIGKDPLDKRISAGTVLSGGQQRLFALTRCLLRNPTFVFLDEPTTNMSTDEKYQLIPVLRAAFAGKTVVVVDHDLPWLTHFVDRFIVLDRGKIAQEGRTEELLQQPGVFAELYSWEATNNAAAAN
jgi:ABC-type multidrug transport system fused ATPase/permease subunit